MRTVVVPTATTRPPALAAAFQRSQGGQRDVVPLVVHAVFGQVLGLDGLEGAGAHVQGDAGGFDAAVRQRGQHRVVEMQRGCGRGHGARARANTVW